MRILHVPTGLAVKCTQERSQAQNKAIALDLLKVGVGGCVGVWARVCTCVHRMCVCAPVCMYVCMKLCGGRAEGA